MGIRWKFIIVLLLISCTDNSEDEMKFFVSSLNSTITVPPKEKIKVVLLTGQSNSEGRALNSSATTEELNHQENMNIWQKDISDFEKLNIGACNNYSATCSQHGLELGLGVNLTEEVYFVKWGVGATEILDHLAGGYVYEEFYNNFVTPAMIELNTIAVNEDKELELYLCFWQGERDSNDNTKTALWAGHLDTWVDLWRSNLGNNINIRLFQIKNIPKDNRTIINQAMVDKADSDALIECMPTKDLDTLDTQHFDYDAFKSASQMLINSFTDYKDTTAPDTPTLIEVT